MEKYTLLRDIKAFGVEVKTFPEGIGAAFDGLANMLPTGDERPYYGISECTKEGIIYIAAALEAFPGEAEKYGCQTYIIEKGDYLAVTVMDWPKKTHTINSVFREMYKDNRSDGTKPCVEIYENMDKMLCLVRMNEAEVNKGNDLSEELESVTTALLQHFSSLNQQQINTIPYEGGWSAAQLMQHVHKSDKGMLEMLYGTVKPTDRKPYEKVAQIKKDFADFSIKMESPEFVLPANIIFDKERLVKSFLSARAKISEAVKTLNLFETCTLFSFPGYGELTRQELINFIIHHTKRHIHQIKKIISSLENGKAETIKKTIEISAPKEKIWHVLLDDTATRIWYSEFSEGTHALTDWTVGSKAIFKDDSNSGLVSKIIINKPHEVLSIEHEGILTNGIEDYESDQAKAVKGGLETYQLSGENGATCLSIECDISPELCEYMSAAWDKALQKIKELSEAA